MHYTPALPAQQQVHVHTTHTQRNTHTHTQRQAQILTHAHTHTQIHFKMRDYLLAAGHLAEDKERLALRKGLYPCLDLYC
jgi:hypothetical protein